MTVLRQILRRLFVGAEALFDWSFGPKWDPLHHLGGLGFFFYWIVLATGIHLYIGFDTSVTEAYNSVEHLSRSAWFLGGVSRSLHRYASDALVIVMLVHLTREFSLDRYRGVRWFSWFTGAPIIAFVYASGIGGYWLVWDKLAQYIAIATTEWLDWLPIFGEPIARNFLAPSSLDNRFFTLLVFLHIAIPLILLFILWLHLQRISKPRINPPVGLAAGSGAALLALSLVFPAASQGHADLGTVPAVIKLDWFYLTLYPLFDFGSYGWGWAVMAAGFAGMLALPFLPKLRRPAAAQVHLEWCNGCGRCAEDCPYAAITMGRRTDGVPFDSQAVVDASLCVGCGICVGACQTSSPFRRGPDLVTGIDLPNPSLALIRERTREAAARCRGTPRILVFGCDHGVTGTAFESAGVVAVSLPCIAMLPPSFIDYVLSRDLADGVLVTGCSATACYNRLGVRWMDARLAGERDPHLRARVPRDRLVICWPVPSEPQHVARELRAFVARLKAAGTRASARPAPPSAGTPEAGPTARRAPSPTPGPAGRAGSPPSRRRSVRVSAPSDSRGRPERSQPGFAAGYRWPLARRSTSSAGSRTATASSGSARRPGTSARTWSPARSTFAGRRSSMPCYRVPRRARPTSATPVCRPRSSRPRTVSMPTWPCWRFPKPMPGNGSPRSTRRRFTSGIRTLRGPARNHSCLHRQSSPSGRRGR